MLSRFQQSFFVHEFFQVFQGFYSSPWLWKNELQPNSQPLKPMACLAHSRNKVISVLSNFSVLYANVGLNSGYHFSIGSWKCVGGHPLAGGCTLHPLLWHQKMLTKNLSHLGEHFPHRFCVMPFNTPKPDLEKLRRRHSSLAWWHSQVFGKPNKSGALRLCCSCSLRYVSGNY